MICKYFLFHWVTSYSISCWASWFTVVSIILWSCSTPPRSVQNSAEKVVFGRIISIEKPWCKNLPSQLNLSESVATLSPSASLIIALTSFRSLCLANWRLMVLPMLFYVTKIGNVVSLSESLFSFLFRVITQFVLWTRWSGSILTLSALPSTSWDKPDFNVFVRLSKGR